MSSTSLAPHRESVLAQQLRSLSGKAKQEAATSALASLQGKFDQPCVDLVAANFPVAERVGFPFEDDANGAYLNAAWSSNPAESLKAWERFFSLSGSREPAHLLAYARLLAEAGELEPACRQLERAMAPGVPYAFFPRAAKLITKLRANMPNPLRHTKVAILGTSTTALLSPVVQGLLLRDGIQADFYEGLYGAWEQEILDPTSGLYRFAPQIVFIVNHWRDLNLTAIQEQGWIEQQIENRKQLWAKISESSGAHVVQFGFDFPAQEPFGYLGSALAGGRTRMIQTLNRQLQDAAPSYVSILDVDAVSKEVGGSNWQDAQGWAMFKQHPSTSALPSLAEHMLAHVRAVTGLTRKVMVLDLDNTLWKGVIGEDGIDGIEIGPGTPAGEAHLALQHYLLDLKKRGILLAVNSKNNLEDAKLPFEKHAHMALRLDDFAAFTANWQDKATNLKEMAAKLSLGLDSFVFLDDNPLEREWVRSQLPQVAVPEPGPNVFHYLASLHRNQYFFSLTLSAEDLARSDQYRGEQVRETLRASSQSIDEFLTQLQLAASAVPVNSANLARVTQLINKTNQFNVTTKRYTEAQVLQIAQQPGAWIGGFHLEDRMGSYGLIGVVICVPNGSPQEWMVDSWLMSCRVLGRQMERFMLDRMIEAALGAGVKQITGIYRPTAKNALVKDLFEQSGFLKIDETAEEVRYHLTVPAEQTCHAPFVRNASVP